ncbi:MAG: dihydropteroate synthase, partial [Myxococcales bacterium]|nr:dihydropteroate synthase [Myxococcales bacterium]
MGFGKTERHNLALLAVLDRIVDLGFPVLVGTSRKSFLGALLGRSDGSPEN